MSIKQAIEALDNALEWDFKRNYVMPYKVRDPMFAALAALRSMPQGEPVPAKNNDVDLLLRAVIELCEATEEAPEVAPRNEHQRGFDKGRRFEAKAIRRAVGDWFQATFCGQSFMGEPVLTKPEVPHCIDGACHLCATQPTEAVRMSEAEIIDIAKNPMTAPCSPWWLKDDVVLGDVRNAAILFARAVEQATAARLGVKMGDV